MKFLRNRWLVVVGALIIQMCLGALYSWSVFVSRLKDVFSYSTTQTQIVFSLALATFALVMIFAGKLQDKMGPRIVATSGGIVLGAGYLLASITDGSFPLIALTVGVISGAGIGLSYVCPIAACVKWFPDKRGMVTGLAVAGFGAGAWVFAKIASNFIEAYGLLTSFMYLGFIFMVAVVMGAQLLRNPPAGWKPTGWNPPEFKSKTFSVEDFEWRNMVKLQQFWMLWIMFVFGAAGGLLVIGILQPYGVHSGLSAAAAANAVGVLALLQFQAGHQIAFFNFASQRFHRSCIGRFCFWCFAFGIGSESETVQLANQMTFHFYVAVWLYFRFHMGIFPQLSHQQACPAINKSFRQAFMQSI